MIPLLRLLLLNETQKLGGQGSGGRRDGAGRPSHGEILEKNGFKFVKQNVSTMFGRVDHYEKAGQRVTVYRDEGHRWNMKSADGTTHTGKDIKDLEKHFQ